MEADEWKRVGLGLDYGTVRLLPTTEGWIRLGREVVAEVADALGDEALAVEVVGSTAVVGLLAKPILDIAVGVGQSSDVSKVIDHLEPLGWEYRGDNEDDRGLLFVLETSHQHRVAHLHVVRHRGRQWNEYVRLRDLLRRHPGARQRYEDVKADQADRHPNDRRSYTDGKTEVIDALLTDGRLQ